MGATEKVLRNGRNLKTKDQNVGLFDQQEVLVDQKDVLVDQNDVLVDQDDVLVDQNDQNSLVDQTTYLGILLFIFLILLFI